MKFFFQIILILYTPGCTSAIIDGIEVDIRQYPFMAAMVETQSQNQCTCAGTILNAVWILGAAHCYFQDNKEAPVLKQYSFIIGSTYCYNITKDHQKIPIIQGVPHPNYESQKTEGFSYAFNDLALFLLERRIDFHIGSAATANLSILNGETQSHRKCRALGWGAVQTDGKSSRHLMEVNLWEFPVQMCYRLLHPPLDEDAEQMHRIDFDTDSAMCAMYPSGEKGVCSGDDGGPLICEGAQVGVTTLSGEVCTTRGAPGVWTRIDRYYKWITETTQYNNKVKDNGCSMRDVERFGVIAGIVGYFL